MTPPLRTATPASIVNHVCDRERSLHNPAIRSDRAQLEQLLHPDYVEFSSNGRLWTRAAVLEALTARPGSVAALNVLEMGAQQATPDTVIVTSVAQHGLRRSVRNSVWVLHDGVWRMRLHQATGIG
jgi:ribonuclease HI